MSSQLAFVFPGGGSQSVGMLDDLAERYPKIKEAFAEASSIVGYDLWELASKGPKEKQEEIEQTLLLMLVANVAVWRVWQAEGGKAPIVMAGHSLGEYSALVCSEAMSFSDAVSLVSLRGKLMREAVPPGKGAMAAIIGLDDKAINDLCETAAQGEVCSPANFNSIGQVVIAGSLDAVNRALQIAKAKKAKVATLLQVDIPSHCALMEPVAVGLREALAKIEIKTPKIAVIHNHDVQSHDDPDSIREALAIQLTAPVRWVETVREMEKRGVTDVVECGPGKALFGMIKWISRSIKPHSTSPADFMEDSLNDLK